MSSKRASSVTVSSLLKLCKGCCSHKGLSSLSAVSTAAERTGLQFSGGYQNDDSSGYQQNRVGFYQESRNKADTYELLNKQRPDYVSQSNAEQNSYGAGQIADGGHINVTRNVHNNLVGHNGSVNGYFGQGNMKMQQKVGAGIDNAWGSGMHANPFVEKHGWTHEPGQGMQSTNAYSSPRPLESQGNLRGDLNQNIDHFQQPQNVHYKGSHEMRPQYPGSGQSQQSLKDDRYLPNLSIAQRSVGGSHLSRNTNPDGESAKASNDSPYRDVS